MSFYFLENTECVHNSSLCCFIVSDVHQFEALLILVTLPCVSIIKSGFRIMSSQQGIVIMAINLSVHSISVCYCSSFLGVNYRRDFLLLKSRGGDRWKCNKNELLAVVECTYPKNSSGLCSSLFAAWETAACLSEPAAVARQVLTLLIALVRARIRGNLPAFLVLVRGRKNLQYVDHAVLQRLLQKILNAERCVCKVCSWLYM